MGLKKIWRKETGNITLFIPMEQAKPDDPKMKIDWVKTSSRKWCFLWKNWLCLGLKCNCCPKYEIFCKCGVNWVTLHSLKKQNGDFSNLLILSTWERFLLIRKDFVPDIRFKYHSHWGQTCWYCKGFFLIVPRKKKYTNRKTLFNEPFYLKRLPFNRATIREYSLTYCW